MWSAIFLIFPKTCSFWRCRFLKYIGHADTGSRICRTLGLGTFSSLTGTKLLGPSCWFNHRTDMIWIWAQHQVKHVHTSHSIASKSSLSNQPVAMLQNLLFCNVQEYTGNLNCRLNSNSCSYCGKLRPTRSLQNALASLRTLKKTNGIFNICLGWHLWVRYWAQKSYSSAGFTVPSHKAVIVFLCFFFHPWLSKKVGL